MKRRRTRRFLLLAIVLFISIGFAVISSNLNITGNMTLNKITWNVYLDNPVVVYGSTTDNLPTINNSKNTLSFTSSLSKPRDYYSFNVDVVNESSFDAMLGSITVSGITSQYSDYLSCVVTYSNGTTPNPNDILYKTARVTLNVKLLYKDITTSQIPENVLNPTITITINYRQANNDAVLVADTNHWNFDYTGSSQTFNVPLTGNYKIELWGAQGSNLIVENVQTNGGLGAYTAGNILFNKNDKYYVYIGETVLEKEDRYSFNGGGRASISTVEISSAGSNGGGSTDIRITNGDWNDFSSLKSRIMVAAAGAGSSQWGGVNDVDPRRRFVGGSAGGLIGYGGNAHGFSPSVGATQFRGGLASTKDGPILSNYPYGGLFGKGGFSNLFEFTYNYGGGGGSGFFGGSGGSSASLCVGSGSGGSSYISGHSGCVAIDESSTEDNIIFKTDTSGVDCSSSESSTYNSAGYNTDQKCSIHYSNKAFTDTLMIDGQGYRWTTVKANTPQGMPNKNGIGTVTGNTGNGFARITYMG